jgi:acyl-CoA thioesterase-1
MRVFGKERAPIWGQVGVDLAQDYCFYYIGQRQSEERDMRRIKSALFGFLTGLGLLASMSLAAAEEKKPLNLVGLGDSLMAGYQLQESESYTAQLQKALQAKGVAISITNAAVSGDTSSGGRERADWSVPDGTDGVILELGANDALRGISPEETRKNLAAIIEIFKARNIDVMLIGIMAPPNMGDDYAAKFNAIYQDLATQYQLALYPFFLDGVILEERLKLDDGMHPNAEGVAVMVERSLEAVLSFTQQISTR